MATQYIKYAKKCKKNFFFQILGGGGMAFFGQGVATPMAPRVKKDDRPKVIKTGRIVFKL